MDTKPGQALAPVPNVDETGDTISPELGLDMSTLPATDMSYLSPQAPQASSAGPSPGSPAAMPPSAAPPAAVPPAAAPHAAPPPAAAPAAAPPMAAPAAAPPMAAPPMAAPVAAPAQAQAQAPVRLTPAPPYVAPAPRAPAAPSEDAFSKLDAGLHGAQTSIENSDSLHSAKTAMLTAGEGTPPAILRVEVGPDEGKEFTIKLGKGVIGRGADCDVVLADLAASRKHVAYIYDGEQVTLIDQGSGNGTTINDKRSREQVLHHGDSIVVGKTHFRFDFPHGAAADGGKTEKQIEAEIKAKKKKEQKEMERARRKANAPDRNVRLVYSALVGTTLFAAFFIGYFYWKKTRGDDSETQPKPPKPAPAMGVSPTGERAKLDKLLNQKRWGDAALLIKRLQAVAPNDDGLKKKLTQITTNVTAAGAIAKAAQALKAGKPERADFRLAEDFYAVPTIFADGNCKVHKDYCQQARALKVRLRKLQADKLLSDARTLLLRHRRSEATEKVLKALKLVPASDEALALFRKLTGRVRYVRRHRPRMVSMRPEAMSSGPMAVTPPPVMRPAPMPAPMVVVPRKPPRPTDPEDLGPDDL